jgi:hypothetical protein
MRADYILQAIPLKAGNHSIRIYFAPDGLVQWAVVSLLTALTMAVASIRLILKYKNTLSVRSID